MTLMYKPDSLAEEELRLACSVALHRQAGIRGYFCSPKRSNINPGSYYAEIGQHTWQGRPEFSGLVRQNVALGTGRSPLLAAMDGYKLVGLNDVVMKTIYLEIELYVLAKAVKTYGKLDKTLETLTDSLQAVSVPYDCEDCIGMLNPHGCYCLAVGAPYPGGPAAPACDEDDDL